MLIVLPIVLGVILVRKLVKRRREKLGKKNRNIVREHPVQDITKSNLQSDNFTVPPSYENSSKDKRVINISPPVYQS